MQVQIKYQGTDTDLPVYQLPDHEGVYIGFNPPTPSSLGYGDECGWSDEGKRIHAPHCRCDEPGWDEEDYR